jgi:hypothetical protein
VKTPPHTSASRRPCERQTCASASGARSAGYSRRPETERPEPEPEPSLHEQGERRGCQKRGPEVEASEDDRTEEKRGDCHEHRRPRRERRDDEHEPDAEARDQPFEPAAVVRLPDRRQDEHRQRGRRILDLEVAIRKLAVEDRLAVPLVDGRVDDLVALVEALVEQRPGDDEERDRRRCTESSTRHGS